MSPTERTLKLLRDNGYENAIVERFISHGGKFGVRKDMFGFGDIIAINGKDIVAVQSCGGAFSEHHHKLTELPASTMVQLWLESGGRMALIGWRKLKIKRGGKRMVYKPKIREYVLSNKPNMMFEWVDIDLL